jgi:hypothetical protein
MYETKINALDVLVGDYLVRGVSTGQVVDIYHDYDRELVVISLADGQQLEMEPKRPVFVVTDEDLEEETPTNSRDEF